MVPLWDPYWEPFWRTAAELNLPVHFHTIGLPPEAPFREGLTETQKLSGRATKVAGNPLHIVTILAAIINSCMLEKYPTLRIVLAEAGIGWIPYALDRMDNEFVERFSKLPLRMKPSEYWRRQCRATFQYDRVGAKLLDELGEETVMWGSDYPHVDGVFPDSQEYIERQFSHLPGTTRRKIVCENVGKFYGLM
jgi:predicted TIM-barrel fold metal-dependent hydrolase